jgi:hypothetical protein
MYKKKLIFPVLLALAACGPAGKDLAEVSSNDQTYARPVVQHFDQNELGDYWYQGEAEISRYDLQQNRYEDVHPGEAIVIFVTEDFLTDLQVKNDHYRNPNSIPILKSNLIRKFPTGLYEYSIMTSVFTPVNSPEWPATLKVTTSSQEWCGQTYTQLNYRKGAYRMRLHSYFESEADQEKEIGQAMLEDELFNRIRINPEALPTGDLQIFPSTVAARLLHLEMTPRNAVAGLTDYEGREFSGEGLRVYRLEYPELKRTLEIVFESAPPYRIAGWKDTHPSSFDQQLRTTVARRTHTIKNAYWKKNSLEDMALRKELGR